MKHIAEFLGAERNGPWLGLDPPPPGAADSAADALRQLDEAFERWSALLAATTDETLAAPVGEPAGRYGDATRRSFALHVLDELIHHTAEAALLRDLYAGQSSSGVACRPRASTAGTQ